jgi:hypothetical protein
MPWRGIPDAENNQQLELNHEPKESNKKPDTENASGFFVENSYAAFGENTGDKNNRLPGVGGNLLLSVYCVIQFSYPASKLPGRS